MAAILQYDTDTGRVVKYDASANTPAYMPGYPASEDLAADVLRDPDLSAVAGQGVEDWRVVDGSVTLDPVAVKPAPAMVSVPRDLLVQLDALRHDTGSKSSHAERDAIVGQISIAGGLP